MRLPAYLATLFFASVLTACGGGGDPVASGDSSDSGASDDAGNGDVTTSSSIDSPALGINTGSSFQEGQLNINTTSLSAGGSTQITATIVDTGNDNKKIVSQEYTILFNSSCASDGRAEFSKEEVVTSSGEVTVTYTARGCSGDDFVTFGLYEGGSTGTRLSVASGSINIAPAEVGSLGFVDTTAPAISISTIGNNVLPKSAELTFRVVDTSGNPIANKTVDFSLTNQTGGISLALASSVTNESGEVSAVVLAGTAHAVTYVVASTVSTNGETRISTSSLPISVTTGLPDQDSFDISVDVLNPGAYDFNGESVNVTVFASDQFNNPVPDGTIVNFSAESGSIQSFCQTTQGVCSVEWLSSGDRPGNHPVGLNKVNELDPQFGTSVLGMTTIVAYTIGESGYTDAGAGAGTSGNGQFDIGEPFVSYPEAFLDDDYDGVRDATEEFFDFDADGSYESAAPGVYQGSLCSDAAEGAGHCAEFVHVRDSIRIVQSSRYAVNIRLYEETAPGSGVYTEVVNPTLATGSGGGSFYVLLQDNNGNIPANGTTISVDGDGYKIYSYTGDMPSSTGELDSDGSMGLPSYGFFFEVRYIPESTPVSITVGAELNGLSTGVTVN